MKIDLHEPILKKNDELADNLKKKFAEKQIFVINLLASPGSGKTSTILALIKELSGQYNIAIIEGDIASNVDAIKVKEAGAQAVQINTGGACHLESNMINKAIAQLDLDNIDIIIIENVGNLVCPVDFDLGEDIKMMILSIPEGDDKPLKYPGIFQASDLIILNKCDTLPIFDFDVELFNERIKGLNPYAPIFNISAVKMDGVSMLGKEIEKRLKVKLSNKGREEYA